MCLAVGTVANVEFQKVRRGIGIEKTRSHQGPSLLEG